MSEGNRKAVLFDLDGTLLDTLQDLADSGNAVLVDHGHQPHSLDEYRTFIGNGMVNLVRAIFPEGHRPAEGEETAAVLEQYRAAYGRNWRNTTRPFPGVPEVLDELARREVPIGVLSNKSHDFTLKCVEEFLPGWEWRAVLGFREGVEKKPDPAGAHEAAGIFGIPPEHCLFVGDSDVDMFTAKNAGMKAVGVSWGFRSVEELLSAGADAILESPSDLLALLD